jgi:hypothetical protein
LQNLIASKTPKGEMKIEIDRSKDDSAKTETAQGLIIDLDEKDQTENAKKGNKPQFYMGSNVKLKKDYQEINYEKGKFIFTSDEDLAEFMKKPEKLSVEFDTELQDFGEFLDFFNSIAGTTDGNMQKISLDWYSEHKNILYSQMKTSFENTLKDKRFEPPFISMVKVFLNYYSKEYLYAQK